MGKGFLVDIGRCVDCGACKAACFIENGWTIQPRKIFTYNHNAIPHVPIINLSLACNHCEKALCMEGCPSGCYLRDSATGAVVIDKRKCIGCKYCEWNCPYDAPKYDSLNGIIDKCNLCYDGLKAGRSPACATSCPTGALRYGELSGQVADQIFPWFPDKNLRPAINIIGLKMSSSLKIIPEEKTEDEMPHLANKERVVAGEWSLIAFSFLSTISVASIISSLINGEFPNAIYFISFLIITALVSLFHLGKPFRAWRAIANIKSSPLCREILLFLLYSTTSIVSVLFKNPGFLITSAIVGLIFLLAIDNVYIYSDKRKELILHSGQTFLSVLLITSFFTGLVHPFIFIAALKLLSTSYMLYLNKISDIKFVMRFFRLALLLVSGISIVTGISYTDPVLTIIFIIGELTDRIIFYNDFSPLNIKTEIIKQKNIIIHEKERG